MRTQADIINMIGAIDGEIDQLKNEIAATGEHAKNAPIETNEVYRVLRIACIDVSRLTFALKDSRQAMARKRGLLERASTG